ncbi:MAG: Na/Pi symporter [Woeseiaceae bacterium]|nr:Na/Pi symporter [Woeseiaceae bacterium]
MNTEFDIWRLAAGLGLFLFGMHQLEQSLTLLAGRPFKKFLREHTAHPFKGVLAGIVSTAALQSSSVVSLIVLAFVGTGIISLASAIGIVFGSNLGTTATGWIVATVGFKLDIEALALPLVAIGGLGVVWSAQGTRRAGFSHLFAGLGLMLMGLEFMKGGAISATTLFDPEKLAAYPPIVFLLTGLMITAVIQSSSATIMITLSALYAGVIPLPSAAAAAIGADLGTTITALLGALAGADDKKRVAIAIVIFNVVTDAIAFVFLNPILYFVTDIVNLRDPLFALVGFHSTINLIGIVIFFPLIGVMSEQLGRRFGKVSESLLRHINQSDLAVPEVAVENMSRETHRLIDQAVALNQLSFGLPPDVTFYESSDDRKGIAVFETGAQHDAGYAGIKQLEGEILEYALRLQKERLDAPESARLGQIIPAVRNAVHAAKCLKDTHHDLEQFRESVDDRFNAWFGRFRGAAQEFFEALRSLRNAETPSHRFEMLVGLKNRNESLHSRMHAEIYHEVAVDALSEVQISTLLNVNRELYHSNQSLLSSLADLLLDNESAADYESIPVTT